MFCIEPIPKRCLYSLGGVPPSREHLEKTVLQRHSPLRVSPRCFSGFIPQVRPKMSSQPQEALCQTTWQFQCWLAALSQGLIAPTRPTVCGPCHILTFSFSRHKQVLQRQGFQNTAKDAEGTEQLERAFPASRFNCSSNADLLKMM